MNFDGSEQRQVVGCFQNEFRWLRTETGGGLFSKWISMAQKRDRCWVVFKMSFDGSEERQLVGCFQNSHKLPRSSRRGEILGCLRKHLLLRKETCRAHAVARLDFRWTCVMFDGISVVCSQEGICCFESVIPFPRHDTACLPFVQMCHQAKGNCKMFWTQNFPSLHDKLQHSKTK